MYNQVILVGRLGRDPELRRLENGTSVTKFSIATNEFYRDNNNELKELTEWHEVVAWRYLAENVEKNLKKGMLAFVEGKVTHRKYTDQNGVERNITEIVANTVKSMGSNPTGGQREGYMPTQEPTNTYTASRDIITPANANTNNSRPQSAPPTQQQKEPPVFEIVPPVNESNAPVAGDDLPF